MMILFYLTVIMLRFVQANVTTREFEKQYRNGRIEAIDLGTGSRDGWSTCEEFLNNTTFDVKSVLDIDWKIFFFWNYGEDSTYTIRFSIPSSLLVDRFKVLANHTGLAVNWTRALLFMETSLDQSGLYIATETSGKFTFIPALHFESDHFPTMILGLKVVEPGYLGIVNCKYRLAYALAPVDKMPAVVNITLAAESIGFKGDANYSYLRQHEWFPIAPHVENDAEEDEQIEIENEIEEL